MSRRLGTVPYRRHNQSVRAIVALRVGAGIAATFLLSQYGTTTSQAEYARVLSE